ncbi:bifunctional phosphopantothenoylcysteine decarboxylase/phosphopantothenate--cysteine ligase CoaBC [Anaerosinus massiliensis]|uniref:bifunctional phosphopantothenoylcysteine decarboxylase/phosphopantothenate--cysteine ligase CoaBC n=1 Tax=Massilibacillus massiliensis TaxID=1806837 RepID=UPI000AE84162|nr:bifunctional phosphopantothenoylcysteine decarboxylase/phosphopantothenate--cysteine ligase CoaBC [Massilibacillus massiliensis]
MFNGKNVVLGVSGGISVYKSVEIVSRLRKLGISVHVIMTESAAKFVTPLTFREISSNQVVTSMWEKNTNWNVEHIALANLADLFVVAPATANIIGKVANGIADDMLSTTIMATKAPVIFAPAMNTNMFLNPIVQNNLTKLTSNGYQIIPPANGRLACGVEGVGRLPEPEFIVDFIKAQFMYANELKNKKVLVTAAGTIEPIDPVRYIGNRSSGKMGYAIAREAKNRGAEVVLISGPTALAPIEGVHTIKVETAEQMRTAVLKEFPDSNIIIKAAAVADYRAKKVEPNKIKKDDDTLNLVLEKNPDILLELGTFKKNNQFLVGFAAESQNLVKYAKQKLERKNLDMIVANDITLKNAGFNIDTNIIKLLYKTGDIEDFPVMSKDAIAKIILDKIILNYKL